MIGTTKDAVKHKAEKKKTRQAEPCRNPRGDIGVRHTPKGVWFSQGEPRGVMSIPRHLRTRRSRTREKCAKIGALISN